MQSRVHAAKCSVRRSVAIFNVKSRARTGNERKWRNESLRDSTTFVLYFPARSIGANLGENVILLHTWRKFSSGSHAAGGLLILYIHLQSLSPYNFSVRSILDNTAKRKQDSPGRWAFEKNSLCSLALLRAPSARTIYGRALQNLRNAR